MGTEVSKEGHADSLPGHEKNVSIDFFENS